MSASILAGFTRRIVALALLAGFAGSPPMASGQTITRQWFGNASFESLGSQVRSVGDVNADGFVDFGIVAYRDGTAYPAAGKLTIVSGADGSTLYAWYGDQANAELGVLGDPIGDVDLDGFDDVLTCEAYVPAGGRRVVGRLVIYSGSNGSVLQKIDGTNSELMRGPLGGTGDLDADGVPDFAIATGTNVHLRSGATGAVIRKLFSPNVHPDGFGSAIANAGDLDGDGFSDLLVVENGCYYNPAESCYAFSGASGAILWTATLSNCSFGPSYLSVGLSPRSVGDVDGDGIPDWVIGAHGVSLYGAAGGSGECRSGKDGSHLYWIGDPSWIYPCWYCVNEFGYALAPAGDVNGDGVPDIVAGDRSSLDDPTGDLFFFSGVDGTMLFHFRGPASAVDFGATVEGGLDIDHDGRLDVLAGDPSDATYGLYAGAAAQLTLRELILDVAPHSVPWYSSVRLAVNSGPPGNPVVLALVDLNGSPLFQPVELTTFDGFRRWTLFYDYNGSMSGVSATLRAFALDAAGRLVVSNDETITFQ